MTRISTLPDASARGSGATLPTESPGKGAADRKTPLAAPGAAAAAAAGAARGDHGAAPPPPLVSDSRPSPDPDRRAPTPSTKAAAFLAGRSGLTLTRLPAERPESRPAQSTPPPPPPPRPSPKWEAPSPSGAHTPELQPPMVALFKERPAPTAPSPAVQRWPPPTPTDVLRARAASGEARRSFSVEETSPVTAGAARKRAHSGGGAGPGTRGVSRQEDGPAGGPSGGGGDGVPQKRRRSSLTETTPPADGLVGPSSGAQVHSPQDGVPTASGRSSAVSSPGTYALSRLRSS